MLGKGNIAGLMEKMKQVRLRLSRWARSSPVDRDCVCTQADVDLEKQAPEMMKRLTSGQWTLRDMREQFQASALAFAVQAGALIPTAVHRLCSRWAH